MNKLENKNIIIATHVFATGPAQDLKEFLLLNKINKLLFVGHPLFYDIKLNGSGYEIYKQGKKITETYKKIKKLWEPWSYLKSIILNFYWSFKQKTKWDIYIGSNNLNAFSGLLLKYVKRTNKVIYYVIDYNPKRFKSKILNKIYHWVDQFCVRHCDETWNLSPRMEQARLEYFGFADKKQKIVPIGIWFKRIKKYNFNEINKHTLVFMGHLIKKQGIQYVLRAIPGILKEIPDFKFLIIGDGNYAEYLKKMAQDFKINECLEFTGYLKDHANIENKLAKSALAVALYEKYDQNNNLTFTYFADPSKIKVYLGCGVPILLTDVPHNSKEILNKKCGLIIDDDKENITRAVINLMKNEELLKQFRKNALNYAKQFDWNLIFYKNLSKIL
ncbi:MAG: glycosyltransferase [Patescibacteria group bacterium]